MTEDLAARRLDDHECRLREKRGEKQKPREGPKVPQTITLKSFFGRTEKGALRQEGRATGTQQKEEGKEEGQAVLSQGPG